MSLWNKIWNGDADWVLTPPTAPSRPTDAPVPIREEVENQALLDLIYSLGGCRVVGNFLDIHASSVSRWTAPPKLGGASGKPPLRRLTQLFKMAIDQGVPVDKLAVLRGAGLDV